MAVAPMTGQSATRWWVLFFLCIAITGISLAAACAYKVMDAKSGPHNPARYDAMLWFFGIQSLTALGAVVLLWRRESGPHGHGLESGRQAATA
jgi:hypothetical protein